MRSFSPTRVDQRGFTLAELLVAIAIVGLIMTGLLTLQMSGNESYLTGSNQVEAQAAIRAALERMTLDLRDAGFDPVGRGACTPTPPPAGPVPANCFDAIINPTPTGFTIQSDWNSSGAIEPAIPPVNVSYIFGGVLTPVGRGEQITYAMAGGTLTRQESGVDAAPVPLLTSVQQALVGGAPQPFFQYLDADGNVTANAWAVRTIVVTLQVGVQNQPPAIWQAGAVRVTMSDRIRLRNR